MHWRNLSKFNKGEQGSTVVEFAMVAGLFFMVIIGVIEFGRLLYTHNALTDAARRGARYAALHKQADLDCVTDVIIYGESHIQRVPNTNTCEAKAGAVPLVNHMKDTNIKITYLGANNDEDPDIDTSYGTNLGTVTVAIQNYKFKMLIPVVNLQLTLDDYSTTLTAESAGEEPKDILVP